MRDTMYDATPLMDPFRTPAGQAALRAIG